MDLDEFREAIRERCQLAEDDQLGTDTAVARIVNGALHWLSMKGVPRPWPWLEVNGVHTITAGIEGYGFDDLYGDELVAVREAWFFDDDLAVTPLLRVQRGEQLERYMDSMRSTPQTWALNGKVLYLRPIPDGTLTELGFLGVRAESGLSAGGDEPLLPEMFHDAVVERGASVLLRRLRRPDDAKIAGDAANDWVTEMRRYAPALRGPGRGRITDPDGW